MASRVLRKVREIDKGHVPAIKSNTTGEPPAKITPMSPPRSIVLEELTKLGVQTVGLHFSKVLILCEEAGRPDLAQLWVDEWKDLQKYRDRIVARQVWESIYDPDTETAHKGANFLANIGGWFAAKNINVTSKSLSIVADAAKINEILSMTDHEPGEPVAIWNEVTASDDREE